MTAAALLALAVAAAAPGPELSWRPIAQGVDYAALALQPKPSIGDGVLHVLRIDPSRARLRAFAVSRLGGQNRTARQWREELKLAAVINAGMYEQDYSTHTGFFRVGEHVNNPKWVKTYQSVLALEPKKPGLPPAAMLDAEGGAGAAVFGDWGTVIQNLRLIRGTGSNAWKQSERRWSEAAVAADRDGKILFLFCRSPYTMHDFNELVLALPLKVARAMHMEGGPEASLSVRGGGVELDLSGSFETGFNLNDGNAQQWPLPNVLGVEAAP